MNQATTSLNELAAAPANDALKKDIEALANRAERLNERLAGLAGDVNTHFFKRFGSAMLLSVIGGLSAIGTGGAGLVLGGGQSAAAAAVTQGNDIGPTVRVRQGEPIRVFTARDLDFSRAPRL